MTEEAKRARFVARIKALPEKEQAAFWRGIMAVVDVGYKTGSAPEDAAKYWVDFYTELKKHHHETGCAEQGLNMKPDVLNKEWI